MTRRSNGGIGSHSRLQGRPAQVGIAVEWSTSSSDWYQLTKTMRSLRTWLPLVQYIVRALTALQQLYGVRGVVVMALQSPDGLVYPDSEIMPVPLGRCRCSQAFPGNTVFQGWHRSLTGKTWPCGLVQARGGVSISTLRHARWDSRSWFDSMSSMRANKNSPPERG